jgi:hypothetical protein
MTSPRFRGLAAASSSPSSSPLSCRGSLPCLVPGSLPRGPTGYLLGFCSISSNIPFCHYFPCLGILQVGPEISLSVSQHPSWA